MMTHEHPLASFTDRLIVGDALDVLPQIPSASVYLECTDPSYNLGKDYGAVVDMKAWDEYEQFTRGHFVLHQKR